MQGTYFSDLQDLSKVLSNLKFLLAERVNGFCQTRSIKCGVPVDRCSHNRLVLSVFIVKNLVSLIVWSWFPRHSWFLYWHWWIKGGSHSDLTTFSWSIRQLSPEGEVNSGGGYITRRKAPRDIYLGSPSRTPSFISASKQRRNRRNLRKTSHQIQFPKQCILKFWTMRSKSCQLPFVTSVQLVEAGTASFTRTFSWKEVLGTRNRSDPDSTSITRRNVNLLKNPPAWPHIKYSFHLPRIRNKQ